GQADVLVFPRDGPFQAQIMFLIEEERKQLVPGPLVLVEAEADARRSVVGNGEQLERGELPRTWVAVAIEFAREPRIPGLIDKLRPKLLYSLGRQAGFRPFIAQFLDIVAVGLVEFVRRPPRGAELRFRVTARTVDQFRCHPEDVGWPVRALPERFR